MSFLPLLILQLVIFIGLIFFLRNILTRNVTRATSHLEKLSQDYAKKEDEINKLLEKTKYDYNQAMTKVQAEVNALKENAHKEIEEFREKTMDHARLQSEEIIQKAEKTKELLIQEIKQKIEARAVERACELIQEVFPSNLQKDIHSRWVEELVRDQLEKLDTRHLIGEIKDVHVKSAFSLTDKDKDIIKRNLREKIKNDFDLKEEIDSSLIAGLIISIGSLVIDGSIRFKLREIAKDAVQKSN